MKPTSLKEYRNKFQPDMSLYLKTAWTKRKAQIAKNLRKIGFFLPVHAVSK
jgi:hypothetical protein